MPTLKFNQCEYNCDGKRDKRGGFRVYCRRVNPKCQIAIFCQNNKKKGKFAKTKEIFFRGQYLTSTQNRNYYEFVQRAKDLLSRASAKRRDTMQAHLYGQLEYLQGEGTITVAERQDGIKVVNRIVYWLDKGISNPPTPLIRGIK